MGAEKDLIIVGMLEDERERCTSAIKALMEKAAAYPKGSIHFRKIKGKDKTYSYPFLKFREEGKSVFTHIPRQDLEFILGEMEKKKKIKEEIRKLEKRVHYLDRLLSVGNGRSRKRS